MSSTNPYIPKIILAFDFDKTLATDSVDAICAVYGVARDDWQREFMEPKGDGWDVIVKRGQALIDLGQAKGRPLGPEVIAQAARELRLYDGVLEMPDLLRAAAREVVGEVQLEFIVLSSGFDEIISASGIGEVFDRILAGGWHEGPDGTFTSVKRVLNHPEKALYLEALGKGADLDLSNGPERAGDYVARGDMACPFDQMIYLGDGASDLQAFGFLTEAGGLAVAVDGDGSFADQPQTEPQRVDAVVPPDYSDGAPLLDILRHGVLSCAHRIAMRRDGTVR